MRVHGWQECIPVMLSWGEDARPVDPAALQMAWSLVPDRDRRLFHEFCCLNQEDDAHFEAMERIGALMRLGLGELPAGRGLTAGSRTG